REAPRRPLGIGLVCNRSRYSPPTALPHFAIESSAFRGSNRGRTDGTSMLSTAFITWPLMGCVQFMCARIGMVTGQGLGAAFGRYFYGVIIFSTAVGIAMDFVGINPVKALFCTAVINGVLAPFLLIGILVVACSRQLMQNQPSSMLSRVVVRLTAVAMFGAAIAMFVL